jgi:hypothetical protein
VLLYDICRIVSASSDTVPLQLTLAMFEYTYLRYVVLLYYICRIVSASSHTVPLQLTLAMFECTYLRGTYLSPPAILPKDVLEASLALPYRTSSPNFPQKMCVTTLHSALHVVSTAFKVDHDTQAKTTPKHYEDCKEDVNDSRVREILAPVRSLEEASAPMPLQEPQSKWTREHTLLTCCDWEKKQVSEAIIHRIM